MSIAFNRSLPSALPRPANRDGRGTQGGGTAACTDREIYQQVAQALQAANGPSRSPLGATGTNPTLVAAVQKISKSALISILRHVSNDLDLLARSLTASTKIDNFERIHVMFDTATPGQWSLYLDSHGPGAGSRLHGPQPLASSIVLDGHVHFDSALGDSMVLALGSVAADALADSAHPTTGLDSVAVARFHDGGELREHLQKRAALPQLVELGDGLHRRLVAQSRLTAGERQHLIDYQDLNYLVKSLLPALAIIQLTDRSTEFSPRTLSFIKAKMLEIDAQHLQLFIIESQSILFDEISRTRRLSA